MTCRSPDPGLQDRLRGGVGNAGQDDGGVQELLGLPPHHRQVRRHRGRGELLQDQDLRVPDRRRGEDHHHGQGPQEDHGQVIILSSHNLIIYIHHIELSPYLK